MLELLHLWQSTAYRGNHCKRGIKQKMETCLRSSSRPSPRARGTFTFLVAPDTGSLHTFTPLPNPCPSPQAHKAPPSFPFVRRELSGSRSQGLWVLGKGQEVLPPLQPKKDPLPLGRDRSQHHLWRCGKPALSPSVPGKDELQGQSLAAPLKPTTNHVLATRASNLPPGLSCGATRQPTCHSFQGKIHPCSCVDKKQWSAATRGRAGNYLMPQILQRY